MATAQQNPWATTGSWNGQYNPQGMTYYYGGRQFNQPQDIYSYLNAPYDPNSLPYGTAVYGSNGFYGGQSDWDQSVNVNPPGPLGAATGPTTNPLTGPNAGLGTPPNMATGAPGTATGTGGGAGAAGTPGAAAGGLYGPGTGGTTAADVFNPLEHPEESIYRALRSSGYNPDFPTWGIQQLLRRAQDIVYGAAGSAVQGGNADRVASPDFQTDIYNLVKGGTGPGGGYILPGATQGRAQFGAINDAINAGQQATAGGGNAGLGSAYLNSVFGLDPGNAASLAESLLYSGLAPSVRTAAAYPLRSYPTRFKQLAEDPNTFGITANNSALNILLQGLIPNYKPLFG